MRRAAGFEPAYLLSDNPDAVNGSPIVDSRGNSRAMTLQRVYGSRPEAAQNYREMLEAKTPAFGLSRDAVRAMCQPVLVREAHDVEHPQAIRKECAFGSHAGHPCAGLVYVDSARHAARKSYIASCAISQTPGTAKLCSLLSAGSQTACVYP